MKTTALKTSTAVGETRTVAVLVYEGCEIIDVTGPAGAFEKANLTLSELGVAQPGYRIEILAETAGPVATSSGISLIAKSRYDFPHKIDTLVVPGSCDSVLPRVMADKTLIHWIRDQVPNLRRLVSVCTGAFILAEAGLLDGRRATTHWMDAERLKNDYPAISVEPDAIFVRDGSIVTAAGVTAGIDMALALIEEDFGKKLALAVARRLVVYLKRPGGQTQFSTHLRAQMVAGGLLSSVLAWLSENFHLKVTVDALAERACMSPRNFARTFIRETGTTPARYLELVRMEQAIRLLEEGNRPVTAIADACGFSSEEQLRRAFNRKVGIGPAAYRERF